LWFPLFYPIVLVCLQALFLLLFLHAIHILCPVP
jgi:hypothetical protein